MPPSQHLDGGWSSRGAAAENRDSCASAGASRRADPDSGDEEVLFALVEKFSTSAAAARLRGGLKRAAALLRQGFHIASAQAARGSLAARVARAMVHVQYSMLLSSTGCHQEALDEALAAAQEAEEVWQELSAKRDALDAASRRGELMVPGCGFDLMLRDPPAWVQRAAEVLVQAKQAVAIHLEYSLMDEKSTAFAKTDSEGTQDVESAMLALYRDGAARAAQLLPPLSSARALAQRTSTQASARLCARSLALADGGGADLDSADSMESSPEHRAWLERVLADKVTAQDCEKPHARTPGGPGPRVPEGLAGQDGEEGHRADAPGGDGAADAEGAQPARRPSCAALEQPTVEGAAAPPAAGRPQPRPLDLRPASPGTACQRPSLRPAAHGQGGGAAPAGGAGPAAAREGAPAAAIPRAASAGARRPRRAAPAGLARCASAAGRKPPVAAPPWSPVSTSPGSFEAARGTGAGEDAEAARLKREAQQAQVAKAASEAICSKRRPASHRVSSAQVRPKRSSEAQDLGARPGVDIFTAWRDGNTPYDKKTAIKKKLQTEQGFEDLKSDMKLESLRFKVKCRDVKGSWASVESPRAALDKLPARPRTSPEKHAGAEATLLSPGAWGKPKPAAAVLQGLARQLERSCRQVRGDMMGKPTSRATRLTRADCRSLLRTDDGDATSEADAPEQRLGGDEGASGTSVDPIASQGLSENAIASFKERWSIAQRRYAVSGENLYWQSLKTIPVAAR